MLVYAQQVWYYAFAMRRCIDCGFLFAVAWPAKSPEAAEFDPCSLRDEEEMKDLREWLANEKRDAKQMIRLILERDLSIRIHRINGGPRSYRWQDVFSVRCWRLHFKPQEIDLRGIKSKDIEDKPVGTLQKMQKMFEPILDTIIDKDRTDCPGYFTYEPGLSAVQHSSLLIETRRAERQQSFEARLADKQQTFEKKTLLLSALIALFVSVLAPRLVDYLCPPGPSRIIVLTPTAEVSPTPTALSLPQ